VAKHRARKRFGQHFLSDWEIGPGQGAITEPLAERAGHLHVVELDRDLVSQLRKRYGDRDNVTVHEADALQFDFGALGENLRVVGNLPYNISTPLLFHLLKFRDAITDMHFMLQKEVVERMAANPGTKAYGRLGIMLGCHLSIESLFDVGPECFSPPPAVTSAVVRLDPLPPGTFDIADEQGLSTLVATAFMQRRKTLRNSLRKAADAYDFEAVGIDPGQRPEQIAIGDYVRLSNHLAGKSR